MPRPRLLILGFVALAATFSLFGLFRHEVLHFPDVSHSGRDNADTGKYNQASLLETRAVQLALTETSTPREQQAQTNATSTAALPAPSTAPPAPATAAISPTTTASPPPSSAPTIERASLLNNPNISCYASNGGHGMDGFGSQLQYLLAAIAIAHHAGINFAYVPFMELHHVDNTSVMEEFAGAAYAFRSREDLGHFAYHTDHQPSLDTIQNLKTRPECSSGKAPFMWYINAPKLILDQHPSLWLSSRDVLRRAYLSTPKPDVTKYFTGGPGVKHVVMYQRRFFKGFDQSETLLPNEYYLTIMKRLRAVHSNAHFYHLSLSNLSTPCGTTGSLCDEQFEDFNGIPNLTMLLDLPLMDTFHVMVSADILVDSMSSFSYSAALLTLGEVYHHSFGHSSLPGLPQPFPVLAALPSGSSFNPSLFSQPFPLLSFVCMHRCDTLPGIVSQRFDHVTVCIVGASINYFVCIRLARVLVGQDEGYRRLQQWAS
jgi:hypothetical protein